MKATFDLDTQPRYVPMCCLNCHHLELGESGWRGPVCKRNTWFPSRQGTCKRQKPIMG